MIDFAAKLKAQRAKEALEKQLAKTKKQSAPNMNPSYRKKDKKVEPLPPQLDELHNIPPTARMKLRNLIQQDAAITRTQSTLAANKKKLVEEGIKPLCKIYSLDKFMVGDQRANYYTSTRKTIVEALLLANGVSPEIILKCTVTRDFNMFKVTGPGIKEDEGFD